MGVPTDALTGIGCWGFVRRRIQHATARDWRGVSKWASPSPPRLRGFFANRLRICWSWAKKKQKRQEENQRSKCALKGGMHQFRDRVFIDFPDMLASGGTSGRPWPQASFLDRFLKAFWSPRTCFGAQMEGIRAPKSSKSCSGKGPRWSLRNMLGKEGT